MSASLEASLRLEISQYQAGLAKAQGDLDKFKSAVKKKGSTLGKDLFGGLKNQLAGLATAAFSTALITRGLRFNATMKDSEIAISKVLAQFQGLDDTAANTAAAAAMQQLIELEPKAAGSLTTLIDGFLGTLAASQSAGVSVKENIDLVGRFANAMANANIPTEQLNQEMRSIVTANIGADSTLAKVLSITNEQVKAATEAGTLYDFLVGRIGKLGEAGDSAAVAFSSFSSAVDQAAGALTSGFFEESINGTRSLTIEIQKATPALAVFGHGLASVGRSAMAVGAAFKYTGDAIANTVYVASLMKNGMSFGDARQQMWDAKAFGEETRKRIAAEEEAYRQSLKQNDALNTRITATKELTKEEKKAADEAKRKAQQQASAKMDLLAEIKDLQLRASGKEREADIAKEAARIQEQTGISEQLALAAAREIIRLKEKAAALDNKSSTSGSGEKSGRKKIVSARDGTTFAKQSGRFGTLDDYYALQQKREVTLDERFATRKARGGGAGLPIGQSTALVPVSNNSLSGRRPGGIPVAGRFGIDGGSLSDRATRAASQQDRTGEGPTGGATLDDVIKVLQAGLL